MGSDATKRFGPRYGRSLRARFGAIESEQRKLYDCPNCLAKKVKRVAAGIWQCKKCDVKFAGKAYTISKHISIRDETQTEAEQLIDEPERLRRRRQEKDEQEDIVAETVSVEENEQEAEDEI